MVNIVTREIPAGTELKISGMHPRLQSIYLARGITSATELDLGLKNLLSYKPLLNIDIAAAILCAALEQQQKIVIVGDFDADGATSVALLMRGLQAFGFEKVSYLVPSRFEYGYGLSPEVVDIANKENPDLIITVDNGIASVAGVARANELGIAVLVTDHHLPGSELPAAKAIIDPNLPGDQFTSKNLAGVGVAFYLLLALRAALRERDWFQICKIKEPNLGDFLDLVAVGTVADVVPLDRNNRILVQQGLQRIRKGNCCYGVKALLQVAGRDWQKVVAADLGYGLGPRLNAAGRLIDMKLGIECLLTDDPVEAQQFTAQLNELNVERRTIEGKMQQQVFAELKDLFVGSNIPAGLCLFNEEWHQGVVGLLASRVKDKIGRPVIVFTKVSKTELKGSARSIVGVHIRDLLEEMATKNPGLIEKFGGHAMAAGLTIHPTKYRDFCKAFYAELANTLTEEDLQRSIHTDGVLENGEFNLELAELLRSAGPWGQGFPAPKFVGTFAVLEQRIVGEKHLKLTLATPSAKWPLKGIAFNVDLSLWPNYRLDAVDIVYQLAVNEYNGKRYLQLIIEHIE